MNGRLLEFTNLKRWRFWDERRMNFKRGWIYQQGSPFQIDRGKLLRATFMPLANNAIRVAGTQKSLRQIRDDPPYINHSPYMNHLVTI